MPGSASLARSFSFQPGRDLEDQQHQERGHERFHDRVLVWAKALPADAADLDKLIRHYALQVVLDADAKKHLLQITNGVARRIVTALNCLRQTASSKGLDRMGVAELRDALKGAR